MTSLFTLDLVTTPSGSRSWFYHLFLAPDEDVVNEPFGLVERANQIGTGLLVARLTSWLDKHDAQLEETPKTRARLWHMLSDANLMKPGQYGELLAGVNIGRPVDWQEAAWSNELLAASMVIYKAVSLYLGAGERFIALDANLAYLYAVWQWFNSAKQITNALKNEGFSPFVEELASAHRLLVQLIDDPRFAQAIRWLAAWADVITDSGPLLRERLRLSLPLVWVNQAQSPGAPYFEADPRKVLPAPGFNGTEILDWSQVRLHPVFFSKKYTSARAAVRSLITDWLLPRYDFKSTLFMAHLLKWNQPRRKAHLFWVLPLVWLGLAVGAIFLGSHASVQDSLGMLPIVPRGLPWGGLVWLLILVGMFIVRKTLDSSIFPYLVLPRLLGGILIGFSALVLENHSFQLSDVIVQHGCLMIVFLWAAVLAAGGFYLFYDVRPLVLLNGIAARRASFTLVLAVLAAMLVGLAAVALATAAWLGETATSCAGVCFFGPFGRVNAQLYFTYVPLALFTGLITQFIFEERTVTTSVWAPEEK